MRKTVTSVFEFFTFQAYYAGHLIACKAKREAKFWILDCTCMDVDSGRSKTCKNHTGKRAVCHHALSMLFQEIIKAGIYPPPCDIDQLAQSC